MIAWAVSKPQMPIRGYALGCALGALMWLGIGAGLWWVFE